MRILAFAASNSRNSINKKLVTYAAGLLNAKEHHVEIIDLNDFEMPLFSVDREKESGLPSYAQDFLDKIRDADALLVSYAEHNGSYTAAYKNLFDWASRLQRPVYQGKPAVLLSTSPGKGGAKRTLGAAINSAENFGMKLRGSLSVAKFHEVFDSEALKLKDEGLDRQLREAVSALVAPASNE